MRCLFFILVAFALAQPARGGAAGCAAPASIGDGWEIAAPAEVGLDGEALCAALEPIRAGNANVHAVVVVRHGRLVAELYRAGLDRSIWSVATSETEFGPSVLHDLRSVSKSVVGLLVGIALQEGKIPSVDTPALSFFPEYPELRSPDREAITLAHLLSMSSGLDWNESLATYGTLRNDETRLYWDWAPARFVLGRPIAAPPGTVFNYNGGGTAVLADVLERTTHQPLRELVERELFAPLGIDHWEWVRDLWRRSIAFAGLRMRPRDLAKVGSMLLDHGQWQGRQIVPAEWVTESLRPRIATGEGIDYGYQWWVGSAEWRGRRLAWGAAFGNGGQRLFLVPDLDLAVVTTAGAYNQREIGATLASLFQAIVAAATDPSTPVTPSATPTYER